MTKSKQFKCIQISSITQISYNEKQQQPPYCLHGNNFCLILEPILTILYARHIERSTENLSMYYAYRPTL